jgi:hypothetical protein
MLIARVSPKRPFKIGAKGAVVAPGFSEADCPHILPPFQDFVLSQVAYAKPPFGGPKQVLAYLGRYTHRVAIANSRLISLSDGKVRGAEGTD